MFRSFPNFVWRLLALVAVSPQEDLGHPSDPFALAEAAGGQLDPFQAGHRTAVNAYEVRMASIDFSCRMFRFKPPDVVSQLGPA